MVVKTLQKIAQLINGELSAAVQPRKKISGICGLDSLTENSPCQEWLTFAENLPTLQQAVKVGFAAVIIPQKLLAAAQESNYSVISCENPRVAFAQLLELFHPRPLPTWGHSSKSQIASSAVIHAQAQIGPNAVIGEEAEISEKAEIWPGAFIGSYCKIGPGVRIMPGCVIGEATTIGEASLVGSNTVIGAHSQIGSDVEIGARCNFGQCIIGDGARLDNLIVLEAGSQIGPLAIVISQSLVGAKAKTGQLSIAASQSLIDDGCRLGNFATAAGRGHVTEDVPDGQAIWSGDPVIPHREDMRQQALRAQVIKHRKRLGF